MKNIFYIFIYSCVLLFICLSPVSAKVSSIADSDYIPFNLSLSEITILSNLPFIFTGKKIETIGFVLFSIFILSSVITGLLLLKNYLSYKKTNQSCEQFCQDKTVLKSIINSAPIAIVYQYNNYITLTNKVFCTITGYDEGELCGKNLIDLFPSEDEYKRFRYKINLLDPDSSVFSIETKWKCKNGDIKNVLIGSAPVKVKCLMPGQIITAMDISPQKKGEEERKKLISMLETQNAEMEQYTYTASHDLKAPLITIEGFLEILKDEKLLHENKQLLSYVERMDKAVKQMRHLLDDLLEIFKVGRLINQPKKIIFSELLNNALDLFEKQIKEKNITIRHKKSFPEVYGDYDRLLVVMINLIDNAIKFIGNDNKNPIIEIGAHSVNDSTVFFIKDNGVGIEPKYHQKIFGLFNKLQIGKEGTGIGLAITKRIIEFHNGSIWVDSQGQGKGTSFCFNLPSKPKIIQISKPLKL